MSKTSTKKLSLLAEIKATPNVSARRSKPWYERLEPALAAEVAEIRAAYARGDFDEWAKSALARVIVGLLKKRGFDGISAQGVTTWLREIKNSATK